MLPRRAFLPLPTVKELLFATKSRPETRKTGSCNRLRRIRDCRQTWQRRGCCQNSSTRNRGRGLGVEYPIPLMTQSGHQMPLSQHCFAPIRWQVAHQGRTCWGRIMRRREFLGVLSGAVAMLPRVARAQQADGMRRIGIIVPANSTDMKFQIQVQAFEQELKKFGWMIGQNVQIETRWATANDSEIRRKRRGIGRTQTRCDPGPWRINARAVAAGDPHNTNRVSCRRRSGGRWLC